MVLGRKPWLGFVLRVEEYLVVGFLLNDAEINPVNGLIFFEHVMIWFRLVLKH